MLSNISLSFLPGAKIGVLGPNGAGKSTLLRIMAGVEEPSSGIAELAPGATVGMLAQEPELDAAKNVRENVEDGVRPLRDLLDRFNGSRRHSRSRTRTSTRCSQSRPPCRTRSTAPTPGASTPRSTARWTRFASRRRPRRDDALGRRAAARRARRLLLSSPDLLLLDEPTNHLDAESVAWLERFLEQYKGTVVAVTHDRYFLDNVAGWILELDRGKGLPFEGNYSSWLEQKQARLAVEEKTGVHAPAQARAGARVGAHEPAGAACEGEGARDRIRAAPRRGPERSPRQGRDPHPRRPAARRHRRPGGGGLEGLRRQAALRGPHVLAAARAASSA